MEGHFAQLAVSLSLVEDVQAHELLEELLRVCPPPIAFKLDPIPIQSNQHTMHSNPLLSDSKIQGLTRTASDSQWSTGIIADEVSYSRQQLLGILCLLSILTRRGDDGVARRIAKLLPGYCFLIPRLVCSPTSEWFAYSFTAELLIASGTAGLTHEAAEAFVCACSELCESPAIQLSVECMLSLPTAGVHRQLLSSTSMQLASLCGVLSAMADNEDGMSLVLDAIQRLRIVNGLMSMLGKLTFASSRSSRDAPPVSLTAEGKQFKALIYLAIKSCISNARDSTSPRSSSGKAEWSMVLKQILTVADQDFSDNDHMLKAAAIAVASRVSKVLVKAKPRIMAVVLSSLKAACDEVLATPPAPDTLTVLIRTLLCTISMLCTQPVEMAGLDSTSDNALHTDLICVAMGLESMRDCLLALILGNKVDDNSGVEQLRSLSRLRKLKFSSTLRPLMRLGVAHQHHQRLGEQVAESSSNIGPASSALGVRVTICDEIQSHLCSLMLLELRSGAETTGNIAAPIEESASKSVDPFELSVSRSILQSVDRELQNVAQSARDAVLSAARWSAGVSSQGIRKSVQLHSAAARAEELVSVLRYVALTCDIPSITNSVTSLLLELYTSEREWHNLHDPKETPSLLGTRGAETQLKTGSGTSFLNWWAASNAVPGSKQEADTTPQANLTGQHILLRTVAFTLSELCCIRSNALLFESVVETLASHALHAAASDATYTPVQIIVPDALANLSACLWATASSIRACRQLGLHGSTYTAHDSHSWESRRAELRRKLLLLATQIGAEACKNSAKVVQGREVLDIEAYSRNSALLINLLPAVAHALVPTDDASVAPSQDDRVVLTGGVDQEALLYKVSGCPSPSYQVPTRSNSSGVKLFRTLWAHLLLSNSVRGSSAVLKTISLYSPVLVVRAPSSFIDMDLSSSAFLRNTLSDATVADFREWLTGHFPELRENVGILSIPHLVYCRSVLELEKLRGEYGREIPPSVSLYAIIMCAASTGTAKAVMYYLEDGGIEREGLMSIVVSIGDVIFRQFLLAMARLPNDPVKDAVLVDHCLYFLSHCCHRYFRVRTAAFRYAVDLLDRYPQLLWHDKCIEALLNMIDELGTRALRGNNPPSVPARSSGSDPFGESSPLKIQWLPYAVDASSALGDQADVLNDLVELAGQWLLRAVVAAPAETRTRLRKYISRVAFRTEQCRSAFGVSVSLNSTAPTRPSDASAVVRPYGMAARMKTVATALGWRASTAADVSNAQLFQAGARMRWSSTKAASAQPPQLAPALYAVGASARGSLGGFYSTAWAHSNSIPSTATSDAERASLLEEDDGSSFLDNASVASRRSRPSLAANRPSKSVATPHDQRRPQRGPGSAIVAAALALNNDSNASYAQTIDSLSLLAADLAPAFAITHDRQSYFLGQVVGMSNMHSMDFSGSRKSAQAFTHVMRAFLRRKLVAVLSVTHQKWRQAASHGRVEPTNPFDSEAIPGLAHELDGSSKHFLHALPLRLQRDKNTQTILLGVDSSSSDDNENQDRWHGRPKSRAHSARRSRSIGDKSQVKGGLKYYFSKSGGLSKLFNRAARSVPPPDRRWHEEHADGNDNGAVVPSPLTGLIKDFKESLADKRKQRDMLDVSIPDSLYRTSAFLCWMADQDETESGPRDLIQADAAFEELLPLVVWVPVRSFSAVTLKAATECWSWVATACPHYRERLLEEVLAAWNWTISNGIGLFSAASFKASPDAPSRTQQPVASASVHGVVPLSSTVRQMPMDVLGAPKSGPFAAESSDGSIYIMPHQLCDCEPHFIWLRFWDSQFRACKTRDNHEIAIVVRAVTAATALPCKLSQNPTSFGARILLASLSFSVLQHVQTSGRGLASQAEASQSLAGSRFGGLMGVKAEEALFAYMHSPPSAAREEKHSKPCNLGDPCARVGSVGILRERIYRCVLSWFELSPMYYETVSSAQAVRADFPYITALCRAIVADRRFCAPLDTALRLVRSVDDEGMQSTASLVRPGSRAHMSNLPRTASFRAADAVPLRSASSMDLRRLVMGRLTHAQVDTPSSQSPLHGDTQRGRGSSFAFSVDHEGGDERMSVRRQASAAVQASPLAKESKAVVADANAAFCSDLRELCLMLLGHEIDRIVAWHNPNDVEERKFADEREYSLDARISSSQKIEWNKLVTAAWKVKPSLALRLWKRLPGIRDLFISLQQLLLCDPVALRQEPLAVELLVTPENVALNVPQLSHLLLWAPCAMSTVLTLMNRCSHDDAGHQCRPVPMFAHPFVASYVVRCLRRFSPDAVVFYLPQLVQALRHDSNGQLADFLFATSQSSMLVAHQLIWLLVSESKHDTGKDAHRPTPVSEGSVQIVSELSLQRDATESVARELPEDSSLLNHGFQKQIKGLDPLPSKATILTNRIISTFPPTARSLFELQYSFWDSVTNISGRLKTEVSDASQRRGKIKQFLKDLQHAAERDAIAMRHKLYRKAQHEMRELAKGDGREAPKPLEDETCKDSPAEASIGLLEQSRQSHSLAGAVAVLGGKVDLSIYAASAPGKGIAESAVNADVTRASDEKHIGFSEPEPVRAMTASVHQEVADIIDVVYVPTAPHLRVLSVELDSGRPMQSASKCPFMLTFEVAPYQGPDSTLRKQERREERRRRERSRMSSHARSVAIAHALKSRTKTSAMTKARVAAQNAASAVRRTVQRQRVQVGLSFERTRKQVAQNLSQKRKEMASGVHQVMKSISSLAKTPAGGDDELPASEEAYVAKQGPMDTQYVEGETSDSDSGAGSAGSASDGGISASEIAYHEAEGIREDSDQPDEFSTPSDEDERGQEVPHAGILPALTSTQKTQKPRSQLARLAMRRRTTRGRRGSSDSNSSASTIEAMSRDGPRRPLRTACIFKVYDDCRQDALVLQVVQVLKHVFEDAHLGLMLYPYRVLPTRSGTKRIPGGILEVIPDVKSRDEIGKAGFTNLHEYFLSTFGRPDSPEFECAKRNLIRSLAAYSVICYLMWIKDRHNGNLLVTSTGAVIHIDFGFVLGITPGGNLGFETAAFKLTQEFLNIMGGSVDTESFDYFSELVSRAFLLARDHMDVVMSLVSGMADSGLPCFLFPDTLAKCSQLSNRFRPDDSALKACRHMRSETLAAANRMTTILYDGIQKLQNNIHSETWQ